MTFILWHLLAICSVMAISFIAGFMLGKSSKQIENIYEN